MDYERFYDGISVRLRHSMTNNSYRPRNLCLAISAASAVLFVVGLIIGNNGKCTAMIPANAAALVTLLLGLLAVGRTAFERRQRQEEHDAEEYRRQHGATELFEDADEAVRLATRANRQYVKYFIPASTVVIGVALGVFILRCWFRWKLLTVNAPAPNPLPMAVLAFCCCIGTLVAGSFFIGVSREAGCRWVRPAAAWLFLSGFLFLLGSGVFFCEYFKRWANIADIAMARLGAVILGILAIELILSFVIEFYRPRMPGEEERPLPESRLLALFSEPGGVARNVALSLDYQFGFRVSEAWFYHFLERTMVPLLMVMALAFWMMTCIVVVEPSETALRERFGRVVNQEPFGAGVYFKLPYPFEDIYKFSSARVQQLTIEGGSSEGEEDLRPGKQAKKKKDDHGHSHGEEEEEADDDHGEEAVILWNMTKKHGDEADFLVGAHSVERVSLDLQVDAAQSKTQQGVGLLSAHIPLFFKVKNLYDYAYGNRDTAKILKNIGQRELLEYFIQSDWNDLLGAGRGKATEELRERIQKRSDDLDLGVEIVFVALTGLHPPYGVGASFDRVTSARVDKRMLVQKAQTSANTRHSQAETERHLILNQANMYRDTTVNQAAAESGRFPSQLLCYRAAPRQYILNNYYEVLEKEGSIARKYVLTGNSKDEVLWLNLERKQRSGLLDLNLSE